MKRQFNNESIKKVKRTSSIKKAVRKTQKEKKVMPESEKPKVRYLKLKEFYSLNKLRETRKVPELRLCGKWLEQAGFTTSEYVCVTVMQGLLIIQNKQNTISEDLKLEA